MTALFQRRVRLTIGTLQIEGLRTQFKVKKTLKKDPNECEISVFNLSSAHRAALQVQGTPFVLEAGYGGQLTQVFSGTVRFGDSVRDGANWVSKFQSGDGEQAFRFATVSESFGKGTPIGAVFAKVAKVTGLDVGQAISNVQAQVQGQFNKGYAAHGKASTEIDSLLRGRGLEWSIQDGKLQVLPIGKAVPGTVTVLNAASGLVGSPEHGTPAEKGATPFLKVKALLQPSIAPGAEVRVESLGATGNFRVETVTHTGDTMGVEYYTEMELRPL